MNLMPNGGGAARCAATLRVLVKTYNQKLAEKRQPGMTCHQQSHCLSTRLISMLEDPRNACHRLVELECIIA
jgi:hypothetical protein